jgi:hypothetical protein
VRVLVGGWFSFKSGSATAGDLLARDLACEWLDTAGYPYDIAVAPPFRDGIPWNEVDPGAYSHAIFVCGPFQKGPLEARFLGKFANCFVIGLDLTMIPPLEAWNPFDFLIERDSSAAANPDIVFLAKRPAAPVVGVCRVESYPGAIDAVAHAAIDRLLSSREAAAVEIDTRLDRNSTGLRTPSEIESLFARVDVVLTTRLHGMVLSLKNGVPPLAIDPEAGGAKIRRQAETIGWPLVFTADSVTDGELQAAFDYCLTGEARELARECGRRAAMRVEGIRDALIRAIRESEGAPRKHNERVAFAAGFAPSAKESAGYAARLKSRIRQLARRRAR